MGNGLAEISIRKRKDSNDEIERAEQIILRPVIDFHFEFTQDIDDNSMPSGKPKGGSIYVKLKLECDGEKLKKESGNEDSNEDLRFFLFNWMKETTKQCHGFIELFVPETAQSLTKIYFKDSFCVNYKLTGNTEIDESSASASKNINTVKHSFYEEIWITCRELSIEGIKHKNKWDN